MRRWIGFYFLVSLTQGCTHPPMKAHLQANFRAQKEDSFKLVRQLTFGGMNTKAHWSIDGEELSFQHSGPGILNQNLPCDQIYFIKKDGSEFKKLSPDAAQAIDPFFLPGTQRIGFSLSIPPQIQCLGDGKLEVLGQLYPYQFFTIQPDGTDLIPLEPGAPRAFNAETAVCQDGSIVFTSNRDKEMALYSAKLDSLGTINKIHPITQDPHYHGGASFSPDCKELVWTSFEPQNPKEILQYQKSLQQRRVKTTWLEIWIADKNGAHAHPVTDLGALSLAPIFTPDGKSILFASNLRDVHNLDFDLYLIHKDGTGLKQITFSNTSDSFPMFSPDGRYLVFSSRRNAKTPHDMNLFIAEWVAENPTAQK